MNYAYLAHITIEAQSKLPAYVQLRDGFINLISNGLLKPDVQLPTSRFLSEHFVLHRKTVVAAMDELQAEGWLKSIPRKGLFVNDKLPIIKPRTYGAVNTKYPSATGYALPDVVNDKRKHTHQRFSGFDDGYADGRLAPVTALGKAYTQALAASVMNKSLSKNTALEGNMLLRTELAKMMNSYRGLSIGTDNILITKGSQMSLYLVACCLLSKGDNVVVTNPNYFTSNLTFQSLGANIIKVGVDKDGMNIDDVEAVCKKKKIRCLYVTSHHHHPTTVTLSVERRLKLLQLAQQYNFAIIEDDYDYDYHYENKPLLPLASYDKGGHVIYIGSFSKVISHVFRVGYVIAPQNLIARLTSFRKIVDRHGDHILEQAIGKLLVDNTIKNHIRKALPIYKERRDNAFALIQLELCNYIYTELPEGGLAFWSIFDKKIKIPLLSQRCAEKGLSLPDGTFYGTDNGGLNACRMGFASLNTKEMVRAVEILKGEIKKLK